MRERRAEKCGPAAIVDTRSRVEASSAIAAAIMRFHGIYLLLTLFTLMTYGIMPGQDRE
jgi:hypothetical protein